MSSIKLPTLTELMAFFFEASLHGWINPDAKIFRGNFGERSVGYHRDNLQYVDRWFVGERRFTEPGWSHGETFISADDHIIWIMQYSGWYDEDVVDTIVKPRLLETYKAGGFHGGRGYNTPGILPDQAKIPIYTNHTQYPNISENQEPPTRPQRMVQFQGCEEVRDRRKRYGLHHYQGMVLADLSLE